MVKKLSLFSIGIIIAAIVAYFMLHTPTDKELIRKNLDNFNKLISKQGKEGAVTIAIKHQAISKLLADKCDISLHEISISGTLSAEELAAQIIRGRGMFDNLSGDIDDVEITLSPDKQQATVNFSVAVYARANGRKFDGVRDLQCHLRKVNGKWLFSGFETRKVLEK